MRPYRILAPAALLAAVLLTACFGGDPIPDQSEYLEQIHVLEEERNALERMLVTPGSLIPDPVCILCFGGAYSSVFETAFPILEKSGFPATVLVREGSLPGQEGMMSADQANTLLEAGWEFVPAGSADIPAVREGDLSPDWLTDLDQTLAALEALGFPAPSCYAFASDGYDPVADQTLADRGIAVALHRWSSDAIRTQKLNAYDLTIFGGAINDGNSVYRIGGATVFAGSSTAQLDVQTACAEKGVIAVCTGQVLERVSADQQNVNCTVTKFKTMLSDIAQYQASVGLRVTTFAEACTYKRDFESDLDQRQAEFDDFCIRAQARIDEIDQELSEIMRKMLNE